MMVQCKNKFCSFEGLTLENIPHGKGSVSLGLISNCGISIKSKNER